MNLDQQWKMRGSDSKLLQNIALNNSVELQHFQNTVTNKNVHKPCQCVISMYIYIYIHSLVSLTRGGVADPGNALGVSSSCFRHATWLPSTRAATRLVVLPGKTMGKWRFYEI